MTKPEIARLIRALAGADAPAVLVARIHNRLADDGLAVVALLRCLLDDRPDLLGALGDLVEVPPGSLGPSVETHRFQREGDYWTIAFAGTVVRVRDMRGLQYLARLLDRPGVRIRVEHLVTPASSRRRPPRPDQARLSVTKAIRNALIRLTTSHPDLAVHLAATVRRGRYCSYLPDPRHPIRWIT
jgi:hypothetical protein